MPREKTELQKGVPSPKLICSSVVESVPRILQCKCCGANAELIGTVDFNKTCLDQRRPRPFPPSDILVPYWKCVNCGFIFTNYMDQWSVEDFQRRIYNEDYVKADPPLIGRTDVPIRERPAYFKGKRLASLFQGSQSEVQILDYGAGGDPGPTGLALIDEGFKVRSYDPYRAGGTDAEKLPDDRFHVIIAVQVFEHCHDLNNLIAFMDQYIREDGLIWIETLLHPRPAPPNILESWYISPRNGHVSIFTFWALAALFARVRINIAQTANGMVGFKRLPQFHNKIFIS